MNKDRTYCTSYSCMIKTCGRHRCHLPKRYTIPIIWKSFHREGCKLYVSKHGWKQFQLGDNEDIV